MATLNTFHCFLQLPNELQNGIWTAYSDYRSGMRHCFSYHGDTVLYAALSSNNYSLLGNLVADFEGLDAWTHLRRKGPPFKMVKPLNRVSVLAELTHQRAIFADWKPSKKFWPSHLRSLPVRKPPLPHIWVNFEQDIFYFDIPDTPAEQSWFRTFFPDTFIKPPEDDYWLFKVRKMALQVPTLMYLYERGPNFRIPRQLDALILRRMKNLQVLQLIVSIHDEPFMIEWKESHWADDVFIPEHYLDNLSIRSMGNSDNASFDGELTHRYSRQRRWQRGQESARDIAKALRRLGITIAIEIMFHIC
ncbi:hypothetical protein PFICI_07042 [Pestalotiopsis fici W106-1]|uniref:Uncharacterized protein n=1 Tax=Pestalotiopsis fici (strain W106-1 / CGMCC3.15140) TaxID=1229662 RepID=W3X7K7_PESFW|nr:uncharacterized protein PFICI_07042 [Pestalotiopsis fici W106-1]ETS82040.1 hypothetical protein PFICI_07042 [Pestalotiopsis fici W106-1]